MEERERNILERNQELLVRNIIVSDEFFNLLQHYNVIPATMIADVKAGKTQLDRNHRLLETLKLRGCDSYRKFRHVLSLTGHAFLADHLYEEETETRFLKAEDMFGKFPSVFNHVSDDIKARLLRYLETKLKEKLLKKSWSNSPLDRSEILDNRKTDYELDKELKNKLETKKKQVQELEDELKTAREEIHLQETEVKILRREQGEAERRFKDELRVQSRFNAANSNSILRLQDKFGAFNTRIQHINRSIHQYLGEAEVHVDNDPETGKISLLEHNVKRVIDKARDQIATARVVSGEREAVLSLLKKNISRHEPLDEILRKYLDKENKSKLAVLKEIEKIGEVLKDRSCNSRLSSSTNNSSKGVVTDFRMLKTLAATVRVEVEHIRKKLQWKDAQIDDLVQEIAALRQQHTVHNSKSSNAKAPPSRSSKFTLSPTLPSPPSSPDSTHEMQVAYKRFDQYLSESHDESSFADGGQNVPYKHEKVKRVSSERVVREKFDNTSQDDERKSLPDVRVKSLQQQGFFERDIAVKLPQPKRSSCDWMTIVVNDDDNMEIEEVTSYMANKISDSKLPPINMANTTTFVDIGTLRSNITTEQLS